MKIRRSILMTVISLLAFPAIPCLLGTPRPAPLASGPSVTLSPTGLTFQCRNVINAGCQCLNYRTTTLSNVGNATLLIKSITTTGAFFQSNNCGKSLAPGKSCTISVGWSEVSSRGAVYISDNAPGTPQKVSLSGIKLCTPR